MAKTFNEKIGITGVILTKTDGDTRGGAALSVLAVTGKPIYFQAPAKSWRTSSRSIRPACPAESWHGRCALPD